MLVGGEAQGVLVVFVLPAEDGNKLEVLRGTYMLTLLLAS